MKRVKFEDSSSSQKRDATEDEPERFFSFVYSFLFHLLSFQSEECIQYQEDEHHHLFFIVDMTEYEFVAEGDEVVHC